METETTPQVAEDFIDFLAGTGALDAATAGKKEAEAFARRLIAEGRNTLENFSLLRDFAAGHGYRALYVAFIELTDGHNAMEVLGSAIGAAHGSAVRDRVFPSAPPPLGADGKERSAYARAIAENMARSLTPEEARAAWYRVQHGFSAESWRRSDAEDREKYARCGSVDEFLDLRRAERDAALTRLRDEDELWYTILINDEVLRFVKEDPEMEVGRRDGDDIYITKVPYDAARYLREKDPRMKRYYACHCPLVREAILQDQAIPAAVCDCSLGHASHLLAGLGVELRGEVLESAVKGDPRCRFVFRLPSGTGGLTTRIPRRG